MKTEQRQGAFRTKNSNKKRAILIRFQKSLDILENNIFVKEQNKIIYLD